MRGRIIPPIQQDAWAARRAAELARQLAPAGDEPVEAVVFDAYGTLFDVGSLADVCAAVAPDGAAFAALWRAKQLDYTWLRTLMDRYAPFSAVTAEALDYALRRHGLAPDETARRDLLAAWLRLAPFPDAPGALARLRGLPLAILSNGSPDMLAPLLAHSGLRDHFRHVLSADAARAYKPDPRVYALAPAALGLPAGRLLFVSANAWDAIGARAYGFRVAWCNRAGQPLDPHGPAPDVELRDLGELRLKIAD
ncbi:MAG TPA: haloacid dehalogenase type II [Thermomicrobiales bacterium]|nr:haloacid dehalogenase type II [Thermomicrobiales bacterium]